MALDHDFTETEEEEDRRSALTFRVHGLLDVKVRIVEEVIHVGGDGLLPAVARGKVRKARHSFRERG